MNTPAPGDASRQRAYVVVLNWNAWPHTIECLESLTHSVGMAWTAVIADNASSDGSTKKILDWAAGRLMAQRADFLGQAPCPKPLNATVVAPGRVDEPLREPTPLVIIENGDNLGFAGGCNVGIRFAMAQPDCAFVWLLNNDCVVDPMALQAMVDVCRNRPRVGMCGSQIRYYDEPEVIQTYGGLLSPWFCTVHNIACGVPAAQLPPDPEQLGYVPGASILATWEFVRQVGLLSEDYFLYYEEPDWAERAKGRFDMALSRQSIVYHRGGASSGSPSERSPRGLRSDFFMLRSRARFARKFYRLHLPLVYLGLLVSFATRVRRRQWRRAAAAGCVILGISPAWLQLPRRSTARMR